MFYKDWYFIKTGSTNFVFMVKYTVFNKNLKDFQVF